MWEANHRTGSKHNPFHHTRQQAPPNGPLKVDRRVPLPHWRPQTFADLVGQDAVVRTLTSAIESGKLAHAYLFSGPRGSGKTSAAKILARCIDCEAGPTATPDNTCENCRAILAGTALDVLEIDAASNRGIEEIRSLRDAVKFAPAKMRMKVYILDEAHMLTKEGANAFLQDARGAAAARGVHPGDHRAREAPRHDPVALPALRVPAHRRCR